jgi:hypothetical protein
MKRLGESYYVIAQTNDKTHRSEGRCKRRGERCDGVVSGDGGGWGLSSSCWLLPLRSVLEFFI